MEEQPNEFAEPQQKDNGTKYQLYLNAKIREQLAEEHLLSRKQLKKINNQISEVNKRMVKSITYDPYYLLQFQANYFCGTCRYITEDPHLKEVMQQVIRGAFLFGKAGIYAEEHNGQWFFYGVSVNKIEYSIFNEIESADIIPLTNALMSSTGDLSTFTQRTLSKEECKNLIIFNWGTLGLSAWITMWPFVRFQAKLLQMFVTQAYSFNKKYKYNIADPSAIGDEIEAWFDALNPFIIQVQGTDLANKFSTEDAGAKTDLLQFITYYKEVTSAYYHIFGRKINVDEKRERNITTEVEASQENFDVVQSDWLIQFDIFLSKLNQTQWCPKISMQKEQEDDFSRTNDEDESETRIEQ